MSSGMDATEKLLRNLHPEDFDNERINSSAFNPSTSHNFKLSLDRQGIVSAENCFKKHVAQGLKSIGVCGVLVEDFSLESINCFEDPVDDNPAHALADFSPFGSNQRKKKARMMANRAMAYGLEFKV